MSTNEHKVEIGKHNGGMSFFIDGKVQPFTSFKINESPDISATLASAKVEIPAMAKQGIMHCWVPVFIDWKGPGQYDFTDMDTRIRTILKLYDDNTPEGKQKAVIVVRVQAAVFTPPWYIREKADKNGRPTNLLEFRNNWAAVDTCSTEETEKIRYATSFPRYGSTIAISPGDTFWDTHAVDCLKAIVQHVRSSDYANRVFGWLPCAFNTNEWFIRTFAAEASCDFSTPTQEAFRKHLRDSGIECGENPVPSPEACHAVSRGEFLDISNPEAKRVEDFSLWLNNRIADIILKFARLIRTEYADSPKLVGFFYGYTFGLSRLNNLSQCGQLSISRLLTSDDIDFICSPCEYFYRADENPFTLATVMGPSDSANSCGKLVFLEDDHLPPHARINCVFLDTRDEWHDEMFFRRNFANVMSHGQQMWWYSLGDRWFKEPYRQKLIGKLHKVGIKNLGMDRSSAAEVAVVMDERSISAMRFNPLLQRSLLTESHGAFFLTGAPFECFELKTFLRNTDHSRFKVVAFLNLFRVDSELLSAIEKLKTDGRTLLFSFAAGLLKDTDGKRVFSTDSASKLVGMKLEEEKENIPMTIWIDPERSPAMFGGKDIRFGWMHMDTGISHKVIGIADRNAETFGFLHSGTPGFGMKRHADWTSVFSSAPCLPPEVLQIILKNAGVHIYAEAGDVIYANRSMIAYVASSGGTKKLTMPTAETLEDVLTGEEIILNRRSCKLSMKRHETRIFWRKMKN